MAQMNADRAARRVEAASAPPPSPPPASPSSTPAGRKTASQIAREMLFKASNPTAVFTNSSTPAAPQRKTASQIAREALHQIERKEREAALIASREREAAAAKIARDKRIAEEERQALVKRIAKMPAAERRKYLEQERLVAIGREVAAKMRKEPAAEAEVDLGLFGLEMDGES